MVVQSLGGSSLGATRSRTLGTDAQSVGSVANRISRKTAKCYCRPELSKTAGWPPPRENACRRVGDLVSKNASAFRCVDYCLFLDGIYAERSAADLFGRT